MSPADYERAIVEEDERAIVEEVRVA